MRKSRAGRMMTNVKLGSAGRALTSGLLCVLLADGPLVAESPLDVAAPTSSRAHQVEMQGDQRVLHALNRMTFGPRPGEVAEVDRIGLGRWFELQLQPQAIDDSALEARLANFPAMMLPQAELMRRFPGPQMLRAMIRQNDPLPRDPVEHAIYADGISFYKEAQAKKAAGQEASGKPAQDGGMESDGDAAKSGSPEADGSGQAMQPVAQARAKRAGRVDLLGGDSSGYMMANRKKNKTDPAPTMDAEMGAGNDTMAGSAAGKRGRARHDEAAFPESATQEILDLPADARVSRILALEPAQLVQFRRSLSRAELTSVARDLSPQQKEIFAALQGSVRMVGAEVLQSRLERDVYSKRQVEAVMTDFWLNHFNVYLKKNGNEPYLLPAYERETIRPHALGRFEDLLVATAKSPAMLVYLDNWQSVGPDSDAAHRGARFAGVAKNPQGKQALKDRGLNENYARELMELHTLGVGCEVSKDRAASRLDPACGKGYTQADVTEVAKVFSGWTIRRPAEGGEYSFEERRHEPGTKTVLGQTIHDNGEKEGFEILHMLAMSPATARFLSTKLAVRFVSDTPPPALIDRMSESYLASGGEIRSVLRTMFHSPEFWSPEVYRAKVKTPLEFVASALRATDADVTNAVPVVQALDRLGMPLYGMQTPNGYSWMSDPWVSTGALVSRMNFALVLSADRLPGARLDWPLLLGEGGQASVQPVALSNARPASAADELRLEKMLLGLPASDRTRSAVLAQSGDATVPEQAQREFLAPRADAGAETPDGPVSTPRLATTEDRHAMTMAGLLLGSPEFQRR